MSNFTVVRYRTIIAASALALALGSGVAQAQKVAWIDMQKALLATSDGKKAAAAIDAKFAPVKTELERIQKDVTEKQDAYTKGRTTMTPDALAALQAQIEAGTTALKRKQEDAQQDLQEEEQKQLGGIMPKLQQAVTQYAAANQIILVVDGSAQQNNMVYADASLNIILPVVTAYEKMAGNAAPAPAAGAPAPAAGAPAPAAGAPAAAAPKAPAPRTAAPAK